jgi:hypothetical protein
MTDPLGLCGNGAGGGANQCGGAEGQAGSEVQQVNSEPLETSAVGDLAMAGVCMGTAMLVCGGASVTGDQPLREEERGSTKVNEIFGSATLASGAGQATSGVVRTIMKSAPVQAAAKSLSRQLDDMVSTIKSALNVGDDAAAANVVPKVASDVEKGLSNKAVRSQYSAQTRAIDTSCPLTRETAERVHAGREQQVWGEMMSGNRSVRDLLTLKVAWQRVSPGHWLATVGGEECSLTMNDFPDERLYTVRAFGETLDIDDAPDSWTIDFPNAT